MGRAAASAKPNRGDAPPSPSRPRLSLFKRLPRRHRDAERLGRAAIRNSCAVRAPWGQITAAQNCGINCAQIATVPMNSVIDTNVAASSMKIFNIAGLPRTQAPAFQISVSAIVPVGNCGFQKIGSGSVNAWLKENVPVNGSPSGEAWLFSVSITMRAACRVRRRSRPRRGQTAPLTIG